MKFSLSFCNLYEGVPGQVVRAQELICEVLGDELEDFLYDFERIKSQSQNRVDAEEIRDVMGHQLLYG